MNEPPNKEQIRLRATYYNNVSVALTVAGFILPIFIVSEKDMGALDYYMIHGSLTHGYLLSLLIYAVGLATCATLAIASRLYANRIIGRAEGD